LGEEKRLWWCGLLDLNVPWNDDLLYGFPYFDQLRSASLRVGLQLASFPPLIRPIVMSDVTQQNAGVGPVDDEPNVLIDPHRPEIAVPCFVEPVELQSWIRWIHLEIKRSGFNGTLLVVCQPSEAVGKRIGYPEFH
jgi:hypothetical protein